MGEQAINDHGVECDDDQRGADGNDASHGDSDALMLGKRIVECVIVQGKRLVERFDFIDDGECETKGTGNCTD